jgi:transcriptional regulatory protein LevR
MMIFEKLKEHISNIEDYKSTLLKIELFLEEHKLSIDKNMELTFWNHIAFLLERMKNSEQNSLEIPADHGIDLEAFKLTDQLIATVIGPEMGIKITAFEKFLIALYFQNMKQKKGGGS